MLLKSIKLLSLVLFLIIFQNCQQTENETEQVITAIQEVTETEAAPSPQYSLDAKGFHGISIGKRIPVDNLEKVEMESGEGIFDAYLMKKDGEEFGYVLPSPNNESLVGTIVITSPNVVSQHGITVGTPFSIFDKKYPNAAIHGSEVEGYTYATVDNIHYRLDDRHWEYDVDKSKIDKNAKIEHITLK